MATNEELKNLITDMQAKMVTNEKVEELIQKLHERDEKINELEGRIQFLENQNKLLERRIDDQESYGRRLNLRIVGIPPPADGRKETAEEVTNLVKEAITALDVPNVNVDQVIDRAHRVGKKYTKNDTGVTIHPIIVRFTSWRSRTAVYRKRGRQGATRFYTDLTKRRLLLKKLADEKTKDNNKVKWAFGDINNNIGLSLESGKLVFFNSEEELDNILGSL